MKHLILYKLLRLINYKKENIFQDKIQQFTFVWSLEIIGSIIYEKDSIYCQKKNRIVMELIILY